MGFPLTTEDYLFFLAELERRLEDEAAPEGTGESTEAFLVGLRCLRQSGEAIWKLPLAAALSSSGLLLMSRVGGYDAMLYGSALISSAQQMSQTASFDCSELYVFLDGMCRDLQIHGCSSGEKTLLGTLSAALARFQLGLERQESTDSLMCAVKAAAQSVPERAATHNKAERLAESSASACGEEGEAGAAIAGRWIACLCDVAASH